jgi:RNA polymerase sigma-70 factor (ECF subfamily)
MPGAGAELVAARGLGAVRGRPSRSRSLGVRGLGRVRPTTEELELVYREHVDAIYGFLSYSVGRDTAEDLTAATFERVVRSWGRFDAARAGERTWIFAIARNLLTDHMRSQKHRSGPSLDERPLILDSVATDVDPLEHTFEVEAVVGWLSKLRPREREVVALRYCADLSVAEIATCLDLTEANVHQICSRALRRLRASAEQERDDDAHALEASKREAAHALETSKGEARQ